MKNSLPRLDPFSQSSLFTAYLISEHRTPSGRDVHIIGDGCYLDTCVCVCLCVFVCVCLHAPLALRLSGPPPPALLLEVGSL